MTNQIICNWDKKGWQGGNTCQSEATEKCLYVWDTRDGITLKKEYFVCSSHKTVLDVMMHGTN
jgi:hypothetical protein